ncbi:non-ribosomal peptide synthetase [Corallococcus sp. Z5C101001]|uniref:non-ribosomal peptide synthase/polyketide synthase n=1 Tax=Corallococcus sp. Z5C101001 TaxID=2596829 RepID=UPI00163DB751|nr:non-ribosomal peptide synthetase [Corallococcus sp. Z5C101001]
MALSPEQKRARLAALLKEQQRQPRRAPASFAQERMWLQQRLSPTSAALHMPVAVKLDGVLDVSALRESLHAVLRRHDTLRTTFMEQDGRPVQRIAPDLPFPLEAVDLRELPAPQRAPEAWRRLHEEARRPFHLEAGPLLHAVLYRLADDAHLLLLKLHHLITDGWSMGVLVGEVSALYPVFASGGVPALPPLAMQYTEFAAWQRQWLQGAVLEEPLAYWRERLDPHAVLDLPGDRPRPAVLGEEGARLGITLPAALTQALRELSIQEGRTLFSVLLAAFNALLHRYSGQDDLTVGTPVAGRSRAELEGLIGLFVNTLPLRVDLSGDPSFRQLTGRVHDVALGAFAHQDVPFEKLVEVLQPARRLNLTPFFQVMFVLQNAPLPTVDVSGLRMETQPVDSGSAKFDLTLIAAEMAHGLRLTAEYRTALFDVATVERMLAHLRTLLEGAVRDPEQPLSRLPLLDARERLRLLEDWSGPRVDMPEACLHSLIEAQVERTPDAVALVFEDAALTYRELDARANQLAWHLRSLGVGAETRVGLLLERSVELVVALLATLKAGGAYVPLDPDHPPRRLAWMLEDARPQVLLAQRHLLARLPPDGTHAAVLCLDTQWEAVAAQPRYAPPPVAVPDALAYVIFTSGSTGRPKGAMNTHRAVVNRLRWMQDAFDLRPDDVVLQKTPFSFDVSVWEFFWPLMTGARLVVARPGGHQEPVYLARLVARAGVTTIHFVPSMLQVFLEEPEATACATLQRVVCSGEALPLELAERCLRRLPSAGLHNLYGPTEAAVDVTWHACVAGERGRSVPIGRPIANTRILLLDAQGGPVPVGVRGELHIGGVQVGRGYLHQPALTAERFVPDAFSARPGARLYRTGDVARWLPDGSIEYLGRADFQVKVRGLRIELGEIEAALEQLPTVRQAVVLARRDGGGDPRLVAYVMVRGEDRDVGGLRSRLQERLPGYMVPAAFVVLDALPLTPSGKVDRKRLPAPDTTVTAGEYVAPRTPTEARLAELWQEVLRVPRVGATEHFFEAGGHSLLATQLLSRVRASFGVELPLRGLFESPTLEALARRIDGGTHASAPATPPLLPVAREEPLPLSFAQERMWFIDAMEPGSAAFNMPLVLRLTGALDLESLRRALEALVHRHEALRTTFRAGAPGPWQIIAAPGPFPLDVIDLRSLPIAARQAEARQRASAEAMRPFALDTGPLLRATVLRLDDAAFVLLLTVHHIVFDGWSLGLLVRELTELYRARASGVTPSLPALPLQPADHAVWQRRWLQGDVLEGQLAYWRGQVDPHAVLELPLDRPRPPVLSSVGARRSLRLSPALTGELKRWAVSEGRTVFSVLLAAFDALLHRYSGQDDLTVGTPVAGRSRPELEALIGLFVNTLPLRVGLSGDPSFRQLVTRVHEVALGGFAHQDVPFEKLVEVLQPVRRLNLAPLFQVMFALQNAPLPPARLPGLFIDAEPAGAPVAKFDLTLIATETAHGLDLTAEYRTELFDEATVARLLTHLHALLDGALQAPEQRLSALPLLTHDERRQVLHDWNDTRSTHPRDASLPELFEAQVRRSPDAIALVQSNVTLSYRQLDTRANQLAHALRAKGVTPGSLVALGLERSPAFVVAVLAVLKAGGAYVPLELAHPRERLALLLEETAPRVLLTRAGTRAALPTFDGPTLCVDTEADTLDGQPSHAPASGTTADSLAYVMFTSGSTGRPKGVMVAHRGVVRLVHAPEVYDLGPDSVLLQTSALAFDASTWELWGALLHGGRLVLAPPHPLSLEELTALLREVAPTVVFLTTALFEQGVLHPEAPWDRVPHVLVGGEAMPPQRAREFLARRGPDGRLSNVYGPTENTTFSTHHPMRADAVVGHTVSIGRPIPASTTYVLEASLHPAPVGVPGELYVGGDGLAWGYLHRPELTAERFIPHPFSTTPGARLYRTGDKARWRADGTLEFLGRTDFQVKLRGFRIEPGEVEAVLRQQPGVREALVVVEEGGSAAERRLVAYVARDGARDASARAALREALLRSVPAYMVPSVFILVEALPLTPNGKVDRKALPAPDDAAPGAVHVAPATPTEERLAALWSQVLRRDPVGTTDNFFELGGHSLLATQLASRVRATFDVALPLRAFFEAPTVAQLARRIDASPRWETPAAPPLVPGPRTPAPPLSFAQQRLWVLDRLDPGNPAYNIASALKLRGALDVAALERAFQALITRHEALRTTFRLEGTEPVQHIAAHADFHLSVVPPRPGTEAWHDAARRLASAEAVRPFDLTQGPLLRATLLQSGAEEHALLVTMHHIVSDGWSMGVLVRELLAFYAAFASGRELHLAPLAVQSADFALWQRAWLQGPVLEAQRAYWRRQLSGAPTLLELPTDRPRPAVQTGRGAVRPFALSPAVSEALASFSQREGLTPFMVLLAAFQWLLSRYSGQDDVSVGTPIAGRTHARTEGLIGFFVNTLVLRARLDGAASFRALLQQVKETTLAAYAHQDVPFEKLVEELQPQRTLSHSPLFQAMLVLQNTPEAPLELPGLAFEPLERDFDAAKADLTLSLTATVRGLTGTLAWRTDLFDASTVERLGEHLGILLEAALAAPDARLDALPLLGDAERARVLSSFNAPEPLPSAATLDVLARFEEQAARHPERVAVEADRRSLTYGALDARANQLAWHLRSLGVGLESRVALCLERSVDGVLALLGVWKAGGAYVPLDPEWPEARREALASEVGASVVVTASAHAAAFAKVQTVCLDTEAGVLAASRGDAPPGSRDAGRLAYVLFTSGSTGRPKGVCVEHAQLAAYVHAATHRLGLEACDSFALVSTFVADLGNTVLFPALCTGGLLRVLSQETASTPAAVADLFRQDPVDCMKIVPSHLAALMTAAEPRDVLPRKRLVLGGESSSWALVDAARALVPGCEVHNHYGPTETTVGVLAGRVEGDGARSASVPLGRPLSGSRLYVLDAAARPAPLGVPGELYVGGAQVARGYLGRPDLTAERFLPDAFSPTPGARMYRTGDRVRWLADGRIEFLGRVDFQVKVRGFRVEPGEVATALRALPSVREAIVVAREDVPGDKRLIAYVIPVPGETAPASTGLRDALLRVLPGYMVPSAFVVLEALPLTPNGKVDRAALPAPEERSATTEALTPRTPTEQLLASLWADLLHREAVGVEDDFFALGGHSLLATQLVARVRAAFGVELPLRALFETPTLGKLAARVDAELQTRGGSALPAPGRRPPGAEAPLSFAQQRLWFLDQLQPGTATYNMPHALRLEGPLDLAVLERAFTALVERHASLRTVFHGDAGEPLQREVAPQAFQLPVTDVSSEAEAHRLASEEALRPFQLTTGPLLRALLLRQGAEAHVLVLTMHHIVSDGWSMGVLVREMRALYQAFATGAPSPLAEPTLRYSDFAVWQRTWIQGPGLDRQRDWWRQHLAGASQALELPTDFPRPALQSFHGGTVAFELPEALSASLQALTRRHGSTLFMVLLAGLQALLSRTSGQDDITVGSPIAGRRFAELEGLIGFFVNTLALRSRLEDNPTFLQLLDRVREATLGAFANQDVPFEKLVEELQPRRDLSRSPLFQVMLILQNAPAVQDAPLPGPLTLRPYDAELEAAKFDLTFSFTHSARGLTGSINYATALFREDSIRRLIAQLRVLLEGAARAPDTRLGDLPLLPPEERQQVLMDWNATARAFDATEVHLQFEAQARRTPDAPALSFGDTRLTYRELHQRVLRLSSRLQALGVTRDTPVALRAQRSPDLVAAMLAILHAGGAYLPLDPNYPADRLEWMLQDSGARVLVTETALDGAVPARGVDVLRLDTPDDGAPATASPGAASADSLAYIIYTSGSTGRPKGVLVPHGTVANFLAAMDPLLDAAVPGTWLAVTSVSFDIHVLEILWTLSRGFQVVLHDEQAAARGAALPLTEVLARHAITHLQCTPSFARTLVLAPESVAALGALRHLLVGGEALPGVLARQLREALPATRLTNMYGPTETTVWSSTHTVDTDAPPATVSIGAPIANTRMYVLDGQHRPVPVGVSGELFIAGDGVVRGYHHRPDLTAERFVPDPFSSRTGARMYRTGDLTRWRQDGTLDFLGRADFQVKVRGFRIELGEVEAVLSRHPDVRQAVAGAHLDAGGDSTLVAWVVPVAGREVDDGALRDFARKHLPEHMVPTFVLALETFPLTPNGKVDRKALPPPEAGARERAYVAPSTPREQQVAELYAGLLGAPRVGATDHFFELGGHSLLATRLISRVRANLQVELPVQTLFEAPTVAAFARRIDAALQSGQRVEAQPLERIPRTGRLPTSYAQQRLWLLDKLAPGSPAYNLPATLRLTGALDVEALRRALEALVHWHEPLRTTFRDDPDGPVQHIAPPTERPLEVVDLRALPPREREAEARRRAEADARRPFSLEDGPMLRTTLLVMDVDEHLLLLNVHHIVSDGWSMGVLVREVTELYPAFVAGRPSPLAPLSIQAVDHAAWQRRWLDGGHLAKQLAWWRRHLEGAPSSLELPTDRPRKHPLRSEAGYLFTTLPLELSEAVESFSLAEGLTPFMVLLAAFQWLLMRYTGQSDISVGSPVAGRDRPELEGLVGFFTNTVVLRTRFDLESTVRSLLRRVRTTVLDVFEHQHVPYEQLQPMRDLHQAPLFQAMFILQNTPPSRLSVPGLTFQFEERQGHAAKFDLTLSVTRTAEGFAQELEYAAALFDASTMKRMLGHLRRLVTAMVSTPELPLSAVDLLGPEERQRVLVDWNATQAPFPDACLHALFQAQALRTPEATAVVFEGTSLTYAQLDTRANQLAHMLRRGGVGPETRVALSVERSPDLVIGMLGILKAGGAWVPVDPLLPRERVAFMLEDSGARRLVTQSPLLERFTPDWVRRALCLDTVGASLSVEEPEPPDAGVTPANLAYLLYTSGSTGRPKGTAVVHRGVANLVTHEAVAYGIGPGSRVLQFASPSFDLSVEEIFTTLCNGATLVLAPLERLMPGEPLRAFLREERLTVISLTPAALAATSAEDLPDLRTVISGGDALPADVVARWAPGRRFINSYGPTEATVVATLTDVVAEEGTPSIGRPLANVRAYVLDARGGPVPVGVRGELYLGGAGVARGYEGRPALTAERFVPDPFSSEPGARLYRTGDAVRWRDTGALEFLGRTDAQVKVRGFRIEPGEVEAALARLPDVRDAVVVARDAGPAGKQLVGYVVARPGRSVDGAKAREALKQDLPDYMVPSALVVLQALPLTPNGKVDRKALPAPDFTNDARPFVAPRTPTETRLAELWSRLLGVPRVGASDDFFDLGGHSLLATQAASRVRQAFDVELPLRRLFEATTLEQVARLIDERLASDPTAAPKPDASATLALPFLPLREAAAREAAEPSGAWDAPPVIEALAPSAPASIPRRSPQEPPPLSFAQQRLWFLTRLDPEGATYNLPVAVRLEGPLDVPAFTRALGALHQRHESLRTTFEEHAHQPVQRIHEAPPLPARWLDLHALPEAERDATLQRLIGHEPWRPFDLEQGPLWRAVLVRMDARQHVLLLTLHHAISDGWSMGVLLEELTALYTACVEGQPARLAPLPVQAADHAVWQRSWLRDEVLDSQLDWWRQQLAGAPPSLELPTDRPRPATQTFRGGAVPFEFPRALWDGLDALCRQENATPSMVVLSAVQALLSRWSGQEDVSVGAPVAGRTHTELEGLIGFFVNTLVLRTKLWGDPSFRTLLGRVREGTLAAYAHQDVPFEKLVEALRPERLPGRTPFFQVMLAYQNAPMPDVMGPGLTLAALPLGQRTAKFDLALSVTDRQGVLRGQLEYNADLFDASTAARLVEHLRVLLEGALEAPDQPLSTLPLLTAAERHLLLQGWREPSTLTPADAGVQRVLAAAARLPPDAVAARWEGEPLTWAEAHRRAGVIRRTLLARGDVALPPPPPLVAVPRTRPLPLSFAQQRLWFIDQLDPGSPSYNLTSAVRLSGALDPRALHQALTALVHRHETLRTTFREQDGQPVQDIAPPFEPALPQVDLGDRGLSAFDEARRLVAEEAARPFDLAAGPLLRVLLLKLSQDDHVLVLNMHHGVSDGWSMGVLVRELVTAYAAFRESRSPGFAPLPLQAADHAVWQRQWLQGEVLDVQLDYWRHQLTGAPALLTLPTDRPRPALQTSRGGLLSLQFPASLAESLAAFCQEAGVTPFMVLLAAWQVLLSRYSGQDDVSVGTPIAGRQRQETEGLIGFFINTLVLRSRVDGGQSFRQLLARVKETALGAYAHQDVPFEKLVEELQPQRSLSHSPLFQAVLVLQNTPAGPLSLPGLTVAPVERDTEATKADLTLSLVQTPRSLGGTLVYRADLFEPATMSRMVEHLRTLLTAALGAPDTRLEALSLLPTEERLRLLETFHPRAPVPPAPRPVHQDIEARARLHPDRPAVAFEEVVLTYGQLDARANQLAWHLKSKGVGPETCVALCLERSVDTVVALLAVWKAGGAYVPLDPGQPSARLQALVAEVAAPVLVTTSHHEAAFEETACTAVRLDTDADLLEHQPLHAPPGGVDAGALAYVLFTSGSTGRPKGVGVTHAQLSVYVRSVTARLGLEECDSFALVSTFAADLGNTVLFPALCTGGLLHVLSQERVTQPDALGDFFKRHPIDCMKIVPSHLAALMAAAEPRDVLPRKRLVLGGESTPWALVDAVHALMPGCEVHNHYGPTETTVGVLAGRVEGDGARNASVPLGRPLEHSHVYVLDGAGGLAPVGVPGELYIGGAQVARGYLGRPDLTAERFLPDAFSPTPGARMYRTGDRARWRDDGRIEFLGRADFQVKVRGFRVEPGEVATALRALPSVHEAIVVAREELPGDPRLVAYVVTSPGATITAQALREALKDQVPGHMVPAAVVLLEALPLTPNGKVDRRALPVPRWESDTGPAFAEPTTPLEEQLAQAFARVLGLPSVGIDDDFFERGGHSLLAVRLMADLRARTGMTVPLSALFQGPTVRRLAARLRPDDARSLLTRLDTGRSQRRPLYFVHGGGGEVLSYAELVRHLGDAHPLYGLSAPGMDGGALPPDSLEALARRYVEEVRGQQPRGPYRLAGWSLGGVVAYEMARQLQDQGEPVELLALIDAYAPTGQAEAEPPALTRLARLAQMVGLTPQDIPGPELERLLSSSEGPGWLEQVVETLARLRGGEGLESAVLQRLFAIHERLAQAMRCYIPASTYPGRAAFFPAASRPEDPAAGPDAGWGRWVTGGVTVQPLPGDHRSLLQPPQVRTLRDHLTALLRDLDLDLEPHG